MARFAGASGDRRQVEGGNWLLLCFLGSGRLLSRPRFQPSPGTDTSAEPNHCKQVPRDRQRSFWPRNLLKQLGYQILSATSGDEALEIARGYPGKIDLLLTDVVMHPVPGPALAEKLVLSRPEMKVIFISGYANASLARAARYALAPTSTSIFASFIHSPWSSVVRWASVSSCDIFRIY